MMDLGFGAFLEKIEQHFGKRVLRVLLLLIGLAVALICGKIIWEIALGPIVKAVVKTGLWQTILFGFWAGIAWVAGGILSFLLAGAFTAWKHGRALGSLAKRARATIDDAERLRAEVQDRAQKVDELFKQAAEADSESRALLDEIKSRRPDDPSDSSNL